MDFVCWEKEAGRRAGISAELYSISTPLDHQGMPPSHSISSDLASQAMCAQIPLPGQDSNPCSVSVSEKVCKAEQHSLASGDFFSYFFSPLFASIAKPFYSE